jgi:hypothetical protein
LDNSWKLSVVALYVQQHRISSSEALSTVPQSTLIFWFLNNEKRHATKVLKRFTTVIERQAKNKSEINKPKITLTMMKINSLKKELSTTRIFKCLLRRVKMEKEKTEKWKA